MSSASPARLLSRALGLSDDRELAVALNAAGGPPGLYHAGAEALDLAPEHRARLEAWLAFTRRMLAPSKRRPVDGPEGVLAYLGPEKILRAAESFWVVMLDSRGRPLGRREVGRGTLTACLVHPREVFAPAIRARAAGVVVVHNHPSGDPSPSAEDEALTLRLCAAGDLLGIPLIDHIVLGRDGFRSLGGAAEGRGGDTRVHMAKEDLATYDASVAPAPDARDRRDPGGRWLRG